MGRRLYLQSFFLFFMVGSPQLSYAILTSDVDFGVGYMNISMLVDKIPVNLSSIGTLDANYNLNNKAWDSSLNLSVTEGLFTNQGNLAWTRIAVGGRYYFTGMNHERVIFDNKVEGFYVRPSPFVGMNMGLSNFSVQTVDDVQGYFNAASLDYDLRLGIEVLAFRNVFLTCQWSILYGVPSKSATIDKTLSYSGTGIYIGQKFPLSSL